MSSDKPRKGRFALATLVVACALAVVALASTGPGIASPEARSEAPPNGVYTCKWISAHPEAAAAAQVTCDPDVFFKQSLGQGAGSGAPSGPITMFSSGCQYLPQQGAVGQGVWAWTSHKYSNRWDFNGLNSSPNYTWYIQTTGGTYTWGNATHNNLIQIAGLPYNEYRWGAQNHSAAAQQWFVCWYD